MTGRLINKITHRGVLEKVHISGLFKYPEGHANAQVQGAQRTEPRGVYLHTSSGAVCSATQQTRRALQGMSVFQRPCSCGFTLVEILIAIFILGLVMATVYVSYSGILKTSHQLEEEGNIYKMARMSMDRMIKDLSALQTSSGSFDFRAEKKTLSNREFYSLIWLLAKMKAKGVRRQSVTMCRKMKAGTAFLCGDRIYPEPNLLRGKTKAEDLLFVKTSIPGV
jgi:prepilin-type N-terminal cleavage/methylation domain-containing protein